jgi:tetratricopeptide (TPR) repeat protein
LKNTRIVQFVVDPRENKNKEITLCIGIVCRHPGLESRHSFRISKTVYICGAVLLVQIAVVYGHHRTKGREFEVSLYQPEKLTYFFLFSIDIFFLTFLLIGRGLPAMPRCGCLSLFANLVLAWPHVQIRIMELKSRTPFKMDTSDLPNLMTQVKLKNEAFSTSLTKLGIRNCLPIAMEVEEQCTTLLAKMTQSHCEFPNYLFIRAGIRKLIALSGELDWFQVSIEDYKQVILSSSSPFAMKFQSLQSITQVYEFTHHENINQDLSFTSLIESIRDKIPQNNSPNMYLGLAYVYHLSEDLKAEIAAFNTFLKLGKETVPGQCDLMIANAYRNLLRKTSDEKYSKLCEHHFQKAICLIDKKDSSFATEVGILLFFQKKMRQALPAFNCVIASKKSPVGLYYRGNILEFFKCPCFAIVDYQRLLKHNLGHGEMQGNAAWNCARLYLGKGEVEKSVSFYILAQNLYTSNKSKLECGIQIVKLQNRFISTTTTTTSKSESKSSGDNKKDYDARVTPPSDNKELADMIEKKWQYLKFIYNALQEEPFQHTFFDFKTNKLMTICEVCKYLVSVDPLGRPLYYLYYADALFFTNPKNEKAYDFLRKAISLFPSYTDWTSPIPDQTLPGVILWLIREHQLCPSAEETKEKIPIELQKLISDFKNGAQYTAFSAVNSLLYEEILESFAYICKNNPEEECKIWTELINLSPFNHYNYTKRSAAYFKSGKFEKAQIDTAMANIFQQVLEDPTEYQPGQIRLWSNVEETAQWVGAIGTAYQEYSGLFRRHKVNGLALQNGLNSKDLAFKLAQMGITNTLHQRIIQNELLKAKFIQIPAVAPPACPASVPAVDAKEGDCLL